MLSLNYLTWRLLCRYFVNFILKLRICLKSQLSLQKILKSILYYIDQSILLTMISTCLSYLTTPRRSFIFFMTLHYMMAISMFCEMDRFGYTSFKALNWWQIPSSNPPDYFVRIYIIKFLKIMFFVKSKLHNFCLYDKCTYRIFHN